MDCDLTEIYHLKGAPVLDKKNKISFYFILRFANHGLNLFLTYLEIKPLKSKELKLVIVQQIYQSFCPIDKSFNGLNVLSDITF